MDINLRKGLKGLLVARNKGGSPKDVPKSQVPTNLPPPPPLPVTSISLLPYPELEEGEVAPSKGTKQQKTVRENRGSSVESKEDSLGANVRQSQCTWAPRLELDGTSIP